MNTLYFGDNLNILRAHLATESVDLIYLDPPFNSNANYNVLFQSPQGYAHHAHIEAFTDTWHWSESAEAEFSDLLHQANTNVAQLLTALRSLLGDNDLMAYLVMMASRLLELHRVLKPTGSLYLHCDSSASHYLKLLLDAVFGAARFRNEIVWKRTSAHNNAKKFGRIADRIFYYNKSDQFCFNMVRGSYSEEQLSRYKYCEGARRYRAENLTAPSVSATRSVLWRGVHPGEKRCWRFDLAELERLYAEGRILLKRDGSPRKDGLKEYLDEAAGAPLQDIWTDIQLSPTAAERLGYPTQKPLALLERIIQTSSREGEIILDPFCGCGTTIHAAQHLNRKWIGIDSTHLAITLIEKRLRDSFPGIAFAVAGTPQDLAGAQDLAARDKYQFQWWACSLVNAQPFQGQKKGADGGIDGLIFFQDEPNNVKKIVVSVKGGAHVSVAMIRDFAHVIHREQAALGLFVTLTAPTQPMLSEAAAIGFYAAPMFPAQRYPRLQILTIEGLLNKTEYPRYPDLAAGGLNFKKAALVITDNAQPALF